MSVWIEVRAGVSNLWRDKVVNICATFFQMCQYNQLFLFDTTQTYIVILPSLYENAEGKECTISVNTGLWAIISEIKDSLNMQ